MPYQALGPELSGGRMLKWETFVFICGFQGFKLRIKIRRRQSDRTLSERRSHPPNERLPLSEHDEGFRRFFIESNQLEAQVVQLVRDISLDLDREAFTRCLLYNAPIEPVPPEYVVTEVPPHVVKTHYRFHRCSECNRVYWSGSHHERMTDRLRTLPEEVSAWVS